MTAAVIQPSLEQRRIDGSPMTVGSPVSSRMMTISGGASTPFITADQNSILIASKPREIQSQADRPSRPAMTA